MATDEHKRVYKNVTSIFSLEEFSLLKVETADSFETAVLFHQITGRQKRDHNYNSQPSESKVSEKINKCFFSKFYSDNIVHP
jgi:hypothetical protein